MLDKFTKPAEFKLFYAKHRSMQKVEGKPHPYKAHYSALMIPSPSEEARKTLHMNSVVKVIGKYMVIQPPKAKYLNYFPINDEQILTAEGKKTLTVRTMDLSNQIKDSALDQFTFRELSMGSFHYKIDNEKRRESLMQITIGNDIYVYCLDDPDNIGEVATLEYSC